jgi:O-antigen ligase/tetratricopeptide (TPR) repeat protein
MREAPPAPAHPSQPKPSHRLTLVAVAIVILACMFNGRSATAMALLAVFTGLGLICYPPRWKIPGVLLGAAGLGLLLGALTLLPANWLFIHPAWHYPLATTWDLLLPTTGTPQPDLTIGAWLTTLIGCGWFFLLLGNTTSESGRRLILRCLTGGMLLITALAVAARFQLISLNWPVGYSAGGVEIGPFPNRNHFAGLCAIGAVLSAALSYDAYKKRGLIWLLFAGGFLLFAAGVTFNTSRAGIGLLFIGIVLWLVTGSMSKDFLKRIAIAVSLIFVAVAVLSFQKDGIGARLFDPKSGWFSAVISDKGRTGIHSETAFQILDSPLTGVGLGQFDSVFAMVHQLPEDHVRLTHPESDWLWWLFEAGLLLLVPLGLAIWWMVKSHRIESRKRSALKTDEAHLRLRLVALIGVVLALLHGLVDVPLHNAGIAFLILLLAAQTISPERLVISTSPLYRLTFRLGGGVILWMGILLTLTAMGNPLYPGRMRLDAVRKITQSLAENGHYQEALNHVTKQLERTPLQWDLHYQSATLRLALRQPSTLALADFNRARAVEPRNLDLCFQEGKVWLRYNPTLAIIPWREFFNRNAARTHFYQAMLSEAQPHPALLQDLRRLAKSSPMKLTALAHTPPGADWQALLDSLIQSDPGLDQLETTERTYLFQLWQARGDRSQLVAALETHPDWLPLAWQLLADEYANASNFEKAWSVQKRFGISEAHLANQSALKENIQQLERNHLLNPNDLRRGVDLYYALKATKRQTEALRLVEKLIALPDSPPFLRQELAILHAQNRDFRRAYETLKAALARRS